MPRDPDEAKLFVELTGSMRWRRLWNGARALPRYPIIRFDLLSAITENAACRWCYGASGVPYDMLKKSVTMGIRKVNITTELHAAPRMR